MPIDGLLEGSTLRSVGLAASCSAQKSSTDRREALMQNPFTRLAFDREFGSAKG